MWLLARWVCVTSVIFNNLLISLRVLYRIDREKVRLEEMKLESLQSERARLENQLIDLRQRVDREREELKRVETLRWVELWPSFTADTWLALRLSVSAVQ